MWPGAKTPVKTYQEGPPKTLVPHATTAANTHNTAAVKTTIAPNPNVVKTDVTVPPPQTLVHGLCPNKVAPKAAKTPVNPWPQVPLQNLRETAL